MSRSVLVTGGNRGIGLAIAHAFSQQGDRVAVAHRGLDSPNTPTPPADMLDVRCDVTDAGQVAMAFAAVERENGPVQVLVSNAGIVRDAPLTAMTEEKFVQVIDTNLVGAYRVSRQACKSMISARWGRIVFISSVLGGTGRRGSANYSASKAGLIGLARSIAREYAAYGITANLVSPGLVRTEMIQGMPEQLRQELLDRTLIHRPAEPEEVAAAVTWLASDGTGYITGIELPVDAGLGLGA
jgi:3-oxoacyl-[acyl-carrier protein] reductase